MTMISAIRLRAVAVLNACALTLTGCFMTPGKFTSELAIPGPDSFTFSYDGEIFFLGLSKIAQMGAAGDEAFQPIPATTTKPTRSARAPRMSSPNSAPTGMRAQPSARRSPRSRLSRWPRSWAGSTLRTLRPLTNW